MSEAGSINATQGIIWTFVAISTLFVVARFFTRLRIVNNVGADDYIIGFSLICCYVFAALVTASIRWGMGQHTSELSEEQETNALIYSTASYTPGILSFTIPKLGVTALLIRILNPSPRFRLFLWLLVGTTCVIIFGCVIILFAQCSPTRALWTPSLHSQPGVRCWDPAVLTYYSIAAGALSAFIDLFLAIYPVRVLYSLQMGRKKKIGLMIILGMGIFACAIAIYKATRLTGIDSITDYTYTSFDVFLWTSIEGNAIIIGSCIPTIAPLLESIFGKHIFRSRSIERTYSYLRDANPSNKRGHSSHHQYHEYLQNQHQQSQEQDRDKDQELQQNGGGPSHQSNIPGERERQGSKRSSRKAGSSSADNHHRWSSTLFGSTLGSKSTTTNNKVRLSGTAPTTITTITATDSTTPTSHMNSGTDDVESQTGILHNCNSNNHNNNSNNDFDDDDFNNDDRDEDEDHDLETDENHIPMDRISR